MKLTNFTKSKELYEYLSSNHGKQFLRIIHSKNVPTIDKIMVELLLNVFKNFPKGRKIFTGYSEKELSGILSILNSTNINNIIAIQNKILENISIDEIKQFINGNFESEENQDFYCETLDGDVVTGEIIEQDVNENYMLVRIESDELLNKSVDVYFLEGHFSHTEPKWNIKNYPTVFSELCDYVSDNGFYFELDDE